MSMATRNLGKDIGKLTSELGFYLFICINQCVVSMITKSGTYHSCVIQVCFLVPGEVCTPKSLIIALNFFLSLLSPISGNCYSAFNLCKFAYSGQSVFMGLYNTCILCLFFSSHNDFGFICCNK